MITSYKFWGGVVVCLVSFLIMFCPYFWLLGIFGVFFGADIVGKYLADNPYQGK